MISEHFTWDTPWELYFHILIFIPILQRLIFLGEPALKAIQIHGHHLKWLFERLKEIPRGYSIAAKFTIGLLVPATIALLRFFIFEPESGTVEVFGKTLTPPDWGQTPDWQIVAIVLFFIFHTYFDWRRVWDTRNLAVKIISVDVEKYRPMVDRMLQMGDWLKGSKGRGEDAMPHERMVRFVGYLAGKVVDSTNTVVDKVMEMPENYAGRWMVVNVAFGMAFHLLPIVFMFILTTTYDWNL
jgi:hypothetical protein